MPQFEFISKQELEEFRLKLLEDIQKLLAERYQKPPRQWLKSHEVRRILTISPAKLQRLRENGLLPFSLLGRVMYYDYEDVQKMLNDNKSRKSKSLLDGRLTMNRK